MKNKLRDWGFYDKDNDEMMRILENLSSFKITRAKHISNRYLNLKTNLGTRIINIDSKDYLLTLASYVAEANKIKKYKRT